MKLYLGVTDNEWYRFLRSRPALDEVNFSVCFALGFLDTDERNQVTRDFP
jgi:hypothetical protein